MTYIVQLNYFFGINTSIVGNYYQKEVIFHLNYYFIYSFTFILNFKIWNKIIFKNFYN